jgi:hypothetical protein
MTVKKTVSTVREDMRVLNDTTNELSADAANWLTPEFWAMTAGAAANLLTVAVLVGWISQSDAELLTKAITAIIGSGQLVVVNSALIWKYIASRTEVKKAAVTAKCAYLQMLAVEKIRQN